jgi:hypothetical protein
MTVLRIFLPIAIVCCGLYACDNATSVKPSGPSIAETDTLITANHEYFHLSFILPKTDPRIAELEHGYDPEHGELFLNMGEGIALRISEEDLDVAKLKEELSYEAVFTHNVIAESPSMIHFQRIYKDGTEYYHAYFEKREIDGTTFLFRSEDMAEFTASDIELMKKIVASATSGKSNA